jgi:hypothetical protein
MRQCYLRKFEDYIKTDVMEINDVGLGRTRHPVFSNTLNLCSSLNAGDGVSHPYSTAATPVRNQNKNILGKLYS